MERLFFSFNSSNELKKVLVDGFNYRVSPVAYDVSIQFESNGLGIDFVYLGDEDSVQTEQLLHFRTMTASSINEKGVKGCAILMRLKDIEKQNSEALNFVKITIQYLPANGNEIQTKVFECNLCDSQQEPIRKAIALAVYYDTLKEVLPANPFKSSFTDQEKEKLLLLKEFLEQQPDSIRDDFSSEESLVEKLLLKEEVDDKKRKCPEI
jgi:Ca-activated chloride channel family protein